MSNRLIIAAFLIAACFTPRLHACSVPVFRYALERWAQDNYVVYAFYRDSVDTQGRSILAGIAGRCAHVIDRENALGKGTKAGQANALLVTSNISGAIPPLEKSVWEKFGGKELPWIVIRFPLAARVTENLWAGPAAKLPADRLLDSPCRNKAAGRLVAGESVVWILLACGDTKKDKQAAAILRRGLDTCRSTLKLPDLDTSDIREYLKENRPSVKMSFSSITVSAGDTAEEYFVKMLRLSEPLLAKDKREPALFPLFGRGRVLYALAGTGISVDRILEGNAFLIGPCACTVKEQNPGKDLLFSADWVGGVEPIVRDEPMPPLQGFEKFIDRDRKKASAPNAKRE